MLQIIGTNRYYKYEGLFREYSLKEIVPIEEQKMKELLEVAVVQSGLKCQIGG